MILLRLTAKVIRAVQSVVRPYALQMKPRTQADSEFLRFIRKTGTADGYLQANPDVAAAKLEAAQHWFDYGLGEGRLFPGIEVRRGRQASAVSGPGWEHFTWADESVVARAVPRFPDAVLRQIISQARHDTAVLAPGADAIPDLRRFNAIDLFSRDGIDAQRMLSAVPEWPAEVLVVPHLVTGGADKYCADLVDWFVSMDLGPIVVLVTDQSEDEVAGWRHMAILKPMVQARILFWKDLCGSHGHSRPETLARFLNVLRPQYLFICNSFLGLETVARFGRGLSQASRIFCFYFSISPNAIGAPYGAYFPRRTLPFAAAVTDNEPTARRLRSLHGEIPSPGIFTLPARLLPVEEGVFAARLAARRARSKAPTKPRRWAWVSRIEPLKGTALLAALAKARPADQFDVFGPLQAKEHANDLDLPNITLCGNLQSVVAADFADHDGFLFTSLFEGMPNVVLEMSQQAIPMVLADVGGLRDTFDESAAVFICHGATSEESVAGFSAALDRVANMLPEEAANMAAAAHVQAQSRHSAVIYHQNVTALLGVK